MSNENERIVELLENYKEKFSQEKQRLGMFDESAKSPVGNGNNNQSAFLQFSDALDGNRQKLRDERKLEYQNYLAKKDEEKAASLVYRETVNQNSFLGFGDDNIHQREKMLRERRQDYQDYLSHQEELKPHSPDEVHPHDDIKPFESPEAAKYNQTSRGRHLAAMQHSQIHSLASNQYDAHQATLQNEKDEKKRQHEEYYEDLRQQIEDKDKFNMAIAARERVEDEAIAKYEHKTAY